MKLTTILALALITLSACQQNETQITTETIKTDELTKVELNKPQTAVLKACTKDARSCPDGSTVGRNSKNNCEFDSCPKKATKPTSKMCTADVKECPDGSYVSRDHYNNCKFKSCPVSKKPTQ